MADAVYSSEHNLPAAAVLYRRPSSANYPPKTWNYDSICSMQLHGQNEPSKESSLLQLASLKQRVRQLLLKKQADELPSRLRVMDQLQSLGVAYHFEEEIRSMLTSMHVHGAHLQLKHDLCSTALLFRTLRAHGIPASTDMLRAFFTGNENGGLEAVDSINLTRDDDDDDHAIDGLVALYETSYLGFPGEAMLDRARSFAMDNLQQRRLMPPRAREGALDLQADRDDGDLPLHWRAPRLQAIWSLKQHRKRNGNNWNNIDVDPLIVQLAEMDFDAVQAVHRAELVEATRWWKEETGLQGQEKLASSRDRLVECFFCAACIAPEPRLAACRDVLTKLGALLVHLDDIYDVCGTLDDLAAFTHAIGGTWPEDDDGDATALLPEYMQAMFSAIRSTSTAAANRVLREHGHDVLPLYKKAWRELCEAFMVEAKWQHERSMPSLDEYLGNGWVTSTAPLLLLHAITMLPSSDVHQQQMADPLLRGGGGGDGGGKIVHPRIVELCSRIFRLCNDEVEPEQPGEAAPSFISCYMEENAAASEEEARRAAADAIAETWKEVNREITTGSAADAAGVALCVNLARAVQCIYRDGDGITSPTESRKQLVKDLLFTPIGDRTHSISTTTISIDQQCRQSF